MHRIILAAACMLGVASADEGKKSDKPTGDKNVPTRRERFIQITNEENKKQQDLVTAMNGLKPGEERDKVIEQMKEASVLYAQKLLDLAREDPKDKIAFTAAFIALARGGGKQTSID